MLKTDLIRTSRAQLRYSAIGSGSRPLIMIPGLSVAHVTDSAEIVAGTYKPCLEDYTIYLFDRPEVIPDGYSLSDMANDTAEACAQLGISGAYVFGASQGGMIAMLLALEQPELVKALAVSSSAANISGHFRDICSRWLELSEKRDCLGLTVSFIDLLYSEKTAQLYKTGLAGAEIRYSDSELARFINLVKAFFSYDVTDRLGDIRCPALVTASVADKVFGYAASREIADGLGCEIKTYGEDFGHALYDEAPDFAPTLKSFFDRF